MSANHLLLKNVDLHYRSVAFQERSLKSLLAGWMGSQKNRPPIQDIHALKKISLEVRPGERVGLLGANGAGKSSFLKMVAGLYPISGGVRQLDGKVRALFDISLGFEPEATGRENILYRGLLLGLLPREVAKMEDAIVDFADLGGFIDYPLKTYSAGMQVRLAFAVSTAVGGDFLLLDEVIGAGDSAFMAKAKRRVLDLVEQSEILILASHDPAALRQLCGRGLVLEQGQVRFDGPIEEAISVYAQRQKVEP
ncbi:MAG: ABC transporter ATP-binding protein [bacterium]